MSSSGFQSDPNPTATLMAARSMEMKAPGAFRTISEVATNLDVPQHVLRFWESKFQQIRPLKRGGGRRYYRPDDVALLASIKDLLYNQGFTIRGVQKLLREGGRLPVARAPSSMDVPHAPAAVAPIMAVSMRSLPSSARREMDVVLNELKAMREMLRQTGV